MHCNPVTWNHKLQCVIKNSGKKLFLHIIRLCRFYRIFLWRFSTAWYGSVRFTFGGFSTGYCTWYLILFSTTSAEVPSDPYRYQNVTCKLCWSLIGRRKSSLLRHWTCDTRPSSTVLPARFKSARQRRIGRNFCLNKRTFLHQPQNSSVVVCWGSSDVPLVDSRGADPARAWWRDAEGKSLMYNVTFELAIFSVYIFTSVSVFCFN